MTAPMSQPCLTIVDLGLIPYQRAWELQKRLQQKLMQGGTEQFLLLCEHNPVITLGRRAKDDNILVPREELATQGVALFDVERGGDVTWHGPGQLVMYPIINLAYYKKDVHWYMRALEEVVIQCLAEFNIEGFRVPGKTGVWVGKHSCLSDEGLIHEATADNIMNQRKIASIGVRLSRWCTLHGISLNVNNDAHGFSLIHPCGLEEVQMTSLCDEQHRQSAVANTDHTCSEYATGNNVTNTKTTPSEDTLLKLVKRSLVRSFNNVFVPGTMMSPWCTAPLSKEKMHA